MSSTGYGLFPDYIVSRNDIADGEIILLAKIWSLTHNEEGFCFATNEYFSKYLNVSSVTVQRRLKKLEDNGYIIREVAGDEDKEHRRIRMGPQFLDAPYLIFEGRGGLKSDQHSNRRDQKENTEIDKQTNKYADQVEEVFEFWARIRSDKLELGNSGHNVQLTDMRESKIRARLKDGYSVDDLKKAIMGCFSNDYNIENGHVGIDLIFRNPDKVDQYMIWYETKYLRKKREEERPDKPTTDGPERAEFELPF